MSASGCKAATLVTIFLLAGCSALQIDVDIYKGPLTNEPEIQARQFAALAGSAKPVLQNIGTSLGGAQRKAVDEILAFYEPRDALTTANRKNFLNSLAQRNSDPRGSPPADLCDSNFYQHVTGLKDLSNASSIQKWSDDGKPTLGLAGLHRGFLETLSTCHYDLDKPAVKEALDALIEAYIVFAERMLFVVNNSRLFPDDFSLERTVLQTLGNSILLHANDLHRRSNHDDHQRANFDHELRAAQIANDTKDPVKVAAELKRALEGAVDVAKEAVSRQPDILAAQALQSAASTVAAKAKGTLDLAEQRKRGWNQEPLRAAYVSLVKPDAQPQFGPSEPKPTVFDAASSAADKSKIEAVLKDKAGDQTIDGKTLVDTVRAWISQQDRDKTLASDRLLRLRSLDLFLSGGGLAFDSFAAQRPDALLTALRGEIEQRKSDAEKDWQTTVAARDLADAALKAAVADAATKTRAADAALTKGLSAASVTLASAALAKGAAALQALSGSAEANGISTPEAYRGAALNALAVAAAANGISDNDKKALAAAGETLRRAPLLPGFPFHKQDYASNAKTGDSNPRHASSMAIDVVDDVITLMRNRRIRALAEGKTDEAANLQAAIDAAYDQRTSLVYLRPAVDYLRNVYSATALQDNSAPEHPNMLLDYLRNLFPDDKVKLAGGTSGCAPSNLISEDRTACAADVTTTSLTLHQARSQLEKVFWQNINRITVAGGGATNYVLAKDDVGNWYVKAYGSDTKQIFESAKGLALFNKGAALDINLLQRAELRRKANDSTLSDSERTKAQAALKDPTATPAAQAFAMKSQERALRTFASEQAKDASDLETQMGKLGASLADAWRIDLQDPATGVASDKLEGVITVLVARVSPLQGDLGDDRAQMAKSVSALAIPKTTTPELSDALTRNTLAVLDDLRSLRKKLAADMKTVMLDPAPTDAARTKLGASVRRVLRDIVESTTKKRLRSEDAYLDSLATTSDVIAGN